MIHYTCDRCTGELEGAANARLIPVLEFRLHVLVTPLREASKVHICDYCLADLLLEGARLLEAPGTANAEPKAEPGPAGGKQE